MNVTQKTITTAVVEHGVGSIHFQAMPVWVQPTVLILCVFVCVCEREREGEKERELEGERESVNMCVGLDAFTSNGFRV